MLNHVYTVQEEEAELSVKIIASVLSDRGRLPLFHERTNEGWNDLSVARLYQRLTSREKIDASRLGCKLARCTLCTGRWKQQQQQAATRASVSSCAFKTNEASRRARRKGGCVSLFTVGVVLWRKTLQSDNWWSDKKTHQPTHTTVRLLIPRRNYVTHRKFRWQKRHKMSIYPHEKQLRKLTWACKIKSNI